MAAGGRTEAAPDDGPEPHRLDLLAQQRQLDGLLATREHPGAWRRSLVQALPVPVVLTDVDGLVLELNGAAWTLVGRRRDELLERPFEELVAEGDAARLREVVRLAREVDAPQQLSLRLKDAEGRETPLDVVASADRAGDGTLTWVGGHGRTGPDHDDDLRTAEAFTEMCRLPLEVENDARRLLARAALLVERALPACDGVSVTLGAPEAPTAQATDSAFAQAVDGAQLQAGDGPCLRAFRTGRAQDTGNLREDARWPRFAELAAPVGAVSVLGLPLRSDRESLGVLNIYSRDVAAFGDRDRRVADLLVSAVVAVVRATQERAGLVELGDQLREALASRAVIEQAKGVLMGREGLTADQAFARLVALSRRSNVKLRDVARQVVDGTAPAA
ncbi:ANTAR domain-containing protein [Aquipuribacter nitratireducens]|uniref:ANTAR domain-containing protein n=1 Tax=Aquipuribacter nitratireducens TaxID=650104 RepID=A0ABW0GNT0_9MICO